MQHGRLDTERKGKILVVFGPCVPFTGHCRVPKLTLRKPILSIRLRIAQKCRKRMTKRFRISNKLQMHPCQWLALKLLLVHINQESERREKNGNQSKRHKEKSLQNTNHSWNAAGVKLLIVSLGR